MGRHRKSTKAAGYFKKEGFLNRKASLRMLIFYSHKWSWKIVAYMISEKMVE
jgi:hypothetical protein